MNAGGPSGAGHAPLDPELARRVARLSFRARKSVEGILSGIHQSPLRGASVVFVEHREYRPGDDPRLLDWRAFARTDRHSIKRFEQETQLRATLVMDRSGSMAYRGAAGPSKGEHAATLLAALGYVLINQGDAAGVITIHDQPDLILPARPRPAQLDRVLTALAAPPDAGHPTDLEAALTAVAERVGRRGVVAVASDLLDLSPDALRALDTMVARQNDVIVLHVLHPDEMDFPFEAPVRFVGMEGEPPVEADPSDIRDAYLAEVRAFVETCRTRCISAGARYTLARTDDAPEHTLAALLSGASRRN